VLAQNKNPVRSEIFFFVCGEAAEAEAPLSCCVVAFFRGFFNNISRTGCGAVELLANARSVALFVFFLRELESKSSGET